MSEQELVNAVFDGATGSGFAARVRAERDAALRASAAGAHEQSPPVPNDSAPIWDLVIADMRERDRIGRERYGTPLQAFNKRDGLIDAYEEALDLVCYLKQVLIERGAS